MKIIILSALVFLSFITINTTKANAGNCDYSWQNASDGSRCGNRAADSRFGGRP